MLVPMSSVYHLNAITFSGDLLDEDPELPSWPDPTSWQICAHTLGPTAVIEEMRSAGLGGEGIKAVKVSPSPRNMCTGRPKRMTVPHWREMPICAYLCNWVLLRTNQKTRNPIVEDMAGDEPSPRQGHLASSAIWLMKAPRLRVSMRSWNPMSS